MDISHLANEPELYQLLSYEDGVDSEEKLGFGKQLTNDCTTNYNGLENFDPCQILCPPPINWLASLQPSCRRIAEILLDVCLLP